VRSGADAATEQLLTRRDRVRAGVVGAALSGLGAIRRFPGALRGSASDRTQRPDVEAPRSAVLRRARMKDRLHYLDSWCEGTMPSIRDRGDSDGGSRG